MQIHQNKALVLKTKRGAQITAAIPKSREFPNNVVVVNWGLEEARVLRNLGFSSIPSPIRSHYDWPGKFSPLEHQKATAEFFTLHQRCFCFNQQGTGKTASAIWAADYLMKMGKVKRVLVVCPVSIMGSAWLDDIFSVAMHRTAGIAHGSKRVRREVIEGDSEFVIINFEGVGVMLDEIKEGGFDLVIVDEATAYKNPRTERWKNLNKVLRPDTWLWLMTGTPAAQSPVDAYGLAKLVCPNKVPRFYGAFRDMVMYKATAFKWVPKDTAPAIVKSVLQPAIRFTKEECLDLPDMVYITREVELTKQQAQFYDTVRTRMRAAVDGGVISTPNAAANLNKLLQISGGAAYTEDGETVEFDIRPRYKVLREVMEETQAKVVVFVPFKHTVDVISEKLTKDKITHSMIDGRVSSSKRADVIRQFQSQEDPKVILIQPQAAAHGVTLTAADTIVWWGPTASVEICEQANARIHRTGQTNKCTVVYLQGSPAEKYVYKGMFGKRDLHARIVDMYKEVIDN